MLAQKCFKKMGGTLCCAPFWWSFLLFACCDSMNFLEGMILPLVKVHPRKVGSSPTIFQNIWGYCILHLWYLEKINAVSQTTTTLYTLPLGTLFILDGSYMWQIFSMISLCSTWDISWSRGPINQKHRRMIKVFLFEKSRLPRRHVVYTSRTVFVAYPRRWYVLHSRTNIAHASSQNWRSSWKYEPKAWQVNFILQNCIKLSLYFLHPILMVQWKLGPFKSIVTFQNTARFLPLPKIIGEKDHISSSL